MTTPSLSSYAKALLRFWYVPVLVIGLAVGLSQLRVEGPDTASLVTTGDVVFTVAVDDPGQDSEGSARIAEDTLATSRLGTYADAVRRSAGVQAILAEAGLKVPPSDPLLKRASSGQLEIVALPAGVVVVRLANRGLGAATALEVVAAIQSEVATTSMELDGLQESPSLVGKPVVVDAKASEGVLVVSPKSPMRSFLLPGFVGFFLGLSLVYLLDWRYRRIENRRDLEDRVQVGVLGEVDGRPADFEVLAQAIARHATGSGVVALAAAPGRKDLSGMSSSVTTASGAVVVPADLVRAEDLTVGDGANQGAASGPSPEGSGFRLVDLTDSRGVTPFLVAHAPEADMVAIAVEYGTTRMRDLESMLIRLSDVSDTPLRVIGVGRI